MIEFPLVTFRDYADGTCRADVPDPKDCSAHGDTLEEACREIKSAMRPRLEVASERGERMPIQTRLPAEFKAAS